jgi:hypothetical protein
MVMLKLSDLEQVLRDNNAVTLLPSLLRLLTSADVEVETPPDAEADPVGAFRKYGIGDSTDYYVKQSQNCWVRLGAPSTSTAEIQNTNMAYTERVTADEAQSAFTTEFWDAEGDHWIRTPFGRYVIPTDANPTYTATDGQWLNDIVADYGPIRFTP